MGIDKISIPPGIWENLNLSEQTPGVMAYGHGHMGSGLGRGPQAPVPCWQRAALMNEETLSLDAEATERALHQEAGTGFWSPVTSLYSYHLL